MHQIQHGFNVLKIHRESELLGYGPQKTSLECKRLLPKLFKVNRDSMQSRLLASSPAGRLTWRKQQRQ